MRVAHYGRLLLCRVPKHTAKPYMHTAKALPCAAHGKEHTAFRRRQRRRLPCVKADPRQKKQKTWEVTWRPSLPCACLTHGKIKIQEIKKRYRPAAAALLGPPPPAPAVAAPPDFRRCAHGPRPSHPWLSPRCQLRPPPAATTATPLPSPLDLRRAPGRRR